MPDLPPVEPPPGRPHDPAMEARVAVLEQIAKETLDVLRDLRQGQRDMRTEHRADFQTLRGEMQAVRTELRAEMQAVRSELRTEIQAVRTDTNGRIDKLDGRIDKLDGRMRAETRWLLVTMAGMFVFLAGIMAKGFRWF